MPITMMIVKILSILLASYWLFRMVCTIFTIATVTITEAEDSSTGTKALFISMESLVEIIRFKNILMYAIWYLLLR